MSDLSNKIISSNFQKLLQISSSGLVADGTGSAHTLYISGSVYSGSSHLVAVSSSGAIIPGGDELYDLGSPTNKWRDLYISTGTLYMGTSSLSASHLEDIERGTLSSKRDGVRRPGTIDVAKIRGLVGGTTLDTDTHITFTEDKFELTVGNQEYFVADEDEGTFSIGPNSTSYPINLRGPVTSSKNMFISGNLIVAGLISASSGITSSHAFINAKLNNTVGSRGSVSLGTVNDGQEYWQIGTNASSAFVIDDVFGTATQRFIIDTSGRVGAGVSTNTVPKMLTVGGSISASGDYFSPEFSSIDGNITASGNISASGDITGSTIVGRRFLSSDHKGLDYTGLGDLGVTVVGGRLWGGRSGLVTGGSPYGSMVHTAFSLRHIDNSGSGDNEINIFGGGTNPPTNKIQINSDFFDVNSRTHIDGNLTVDGNITSSGYIYSKSHITASGNIWVSGSVKNIYPYDTHNIHLNSDGEITASNTASFSQVLVDRFVKGKDNQGTYLDMNNSYLALNWDGNKMLTADEYGGQGRVVIGNVYGAGDNIDPDFVVRTGQAYMEYDGDIGQAMNDLFIVTASGAVLVGTDVTTGQRMVVHGSISMSKQLLLKGSASIGNSNAKPPMYGLYLSGSISSSDTNGVHSFGGNVGIGTSNPTDKLVVRGFNESASINIMVDEDPNGDSYSASLKFSDSDVSNQWQKLEFNPSSKDLKIRSHDTDNILYLKNDGIVGIGTDNPSASLDITGDLRTSTHITASGNISSSGDITASGFHIPRDAKVSFGSDFPDDEGGSFISASATDFGTLFLKSNGPMHLDAGTGLKMHDWRYGNGMRYFSTNPSMKAVAIGPNASTTSAGGKSILTINGDMVLGNNSNPGHITMSGGGHLSGSQGSILGFNDISASGDLILEGTGNITASGNISSSLTSTGSFGFGHFDGRVGIGTKNPGSSGTSGTKLEVVGNISSSGGDGWITAHRVNVAYDAGSHKGINFVGSDGTIRFSKQDDTGAADTLDVSANSSRLKLSAGNQIHISTGTTSDRVAFKYSPTDLTTIKFNTATGNMSSSGDFIITNISAGGHITASGNISSSGTITANELTIGAGGVGGLSATNITASGDISSSGTLTVGSFSPVDITVTGNLTSSGDISGSISSTGSLGKLTLIGEADNSEFVGLEVRNTSPVGSFHDKAVIKFGHLFDSDAGKIVAGRDGDYSATAAKRSFLEFYTSSPNIGDTKKFKIDANEGNVIIWTGSLELPGKTVLGSHAGGHITASGDLSASGDIYGTGNLQIDGTSIDFNNLPVSQSGLNSGQLYTLSGSQLPFSGSGDPEIATKKFVLIA